MGDKIRTMAALARNGLRAARRGFHSSGPCQGSISAGSKCPQRQGPAEMAELPANFHALTGGANHTAIIGSSLEKSIGYNNPGGLHEQAELWWDDGRAMVEPVFDADHIPLQEARRMLGADLPSLVWCLESNTGVTQLEPAQRCQETCQTQKFGRGTSTLLLQAQRLRLQLRRRKTNKPALLAASKVSDRHIID